MKKTIFSSILVLILFFVFACSDSGNPPEKVMKKNAKEHYKTRGETLIYPELKQIIEVDDEKQAKKILEKILSPIIGTSKMFDDIENTGESVLGYGTVLLQKVTEAMTEDNKVAQIKLIPLMFFVNQDKVNNGLWSYPEMEEELRIEMIYKQHYYLAVALFVESTLRGRSTEIIIESMKMSLAILTYSCKYLQKLPGVTTELLPCHFHRYKTLPLTFSSFSSKVHIFHKLSATHFCGRLFLTLNTHMH